MNKKDFIESLNHLKAQSSVTASDFNLSNLIISLHKEHFNKIQSYKPDVLEQLFKKISNDKGVEALENCRKIVLLECFLDSWKDIFSDKYPIDVQNQFIEYAERIFEMCQSEQGWGGNPDVYWKDLAVARQQMFPAGGGRLIEVYSGFGFSQGLSVNPWQLFRFIKLLLCTGGTKGYYQIHLHTPLLCQFNQQSMWDCYLNTAQMLMKYKKIKGVFSSSWLYDPQLENVSPKLMYLQRIWLDNGAANFYVGTDKSKNAFVKSKTRLKLYEQGKYIPKVYLVVWPRKKMIEWAKSCLDEKKKQNQS